MSNPMFSLEENVVLRTIMSSYNVLVHIIMGVIVGIALLFGLKMNFNATSVPEDIILLHIVLCVPGFILIMSQSLLGMTAYNAWSYSLSTVNKRRAHWILQILGSGLGITGCIIIMIYKDVNFNTTHGILGLVALIFTTITMLNGVACLYSDKLERFIPPIVTKIIHIILGISTFAIISACLCYGFNKTMFRLWTSDSVTLGVIALTGVYTFIIIFNPLSTLCKKFVKLIKARLEK